MAASRTCVFKGASTCVIKQPPVARTDWQPAADGVRTAVLSPTRRVSRRGLTQANLSPGFPGRFIMEIFGESVPLLITGAGRFLSLVLKKCQTRLQYSRVSSA